MNKKGKMVAVSVALILGIATLTMSDEEEVVINEAPKGYSYSPYNHLVPDIQIKLMTKSTRPLMYSMMNDRKGELPSYAVGYEYLISSLNVRESVLNKRPFIQYVNSDKETIKMQPRGIYTGIQYSGKSNLDRQVFDEVAFGFLAKWTGTKLPDKIAESVFGDAVNKDIGFPLSILYFQRQFLEQSELKGFSSVSGYTPLFADYNYLYDKYISKGIPFEPDTLDGLRAKISNNIVSITKYLDEKNKKDDPRIDEKAVLLLEFYLNEDMKLIKTLERDVRMVTPPDNSEKEILRIKRLEAEARRKQVEANELEKAQRKSRRVSTSIVK